MSAPYKIGVFGSSAGNMKEGLPLAVELGRALGQHADSVIVITGACPGLPYAAATTAAQEGVKVWGFSSSLDAADQRQEYPDDDLHIYDKLVYIPQEFPFAGSERARKKYRNVLSTASCDAGIVVSGRWGTLNEFTNLLDMQKVIGVLTESGGIADEIKSLTQKITKEGQGTVLFDSDPQTLVEKIMSHLKTA